MSNSPVLPNPWTRLRQAIHEYFTLSELETLCLELGIRHEDIPGSAYKAKVYNFVDHIYRRDRTEEMLAWLQKERPHAVWPTPQELSIAPYISETVDGAARRLSGIALIDQIRQNRRLRETLNSGEIEQKYNQHIYVRRHKAEDSFRSFIRQHERLCFVVTGGAGKGKTNLLSHLAEEAIKPTAANDYLSVLLTGSKLDLHKKNVADWLVDSLQPTDGDNYSLAEICQALREQQTGLLVFLDAVNELVGQDAFRLFNKQLSELVDKVRKQNYPIRFCISCRSDFWPQFVDAAWARQETFAAEMDAPTVTLDDFPVDEIDNIIRRYFDYYRIDGSLTGDAKDRCRDPIMLRYLCEAYTARRQDERERPSAEIELRAIGQIRTLRRKEVFDRFVEQRRTAIFQAAGQALETENANIKYESTSKYLIAISNRMLQEKRPFITLDEVKSVAQEMGHSDAQLDRAFLANHPRSILFRFVDEGIILDKRREGEYEFVFETYFEYSLGRYIALERWPKLGQQGGEEAIVQDFANLLEQHTELLLQNNFTNLFGGLQFAILTMETDPSGHYVEYPSLYIRLMERMMSAQNVKFNWVQQSLATIRETQLADEGYWQKDQTIALRDEAEDRFEQMLGILDNLVATQDFVVLWDLENTVYRLATANLALTLRRIHRWAVSDGLRPIFAAHALSRLSEIDPPRIVQEIEELAETELFQQNFWLARALISAALNLVRRSWSDEKLFHLQDKHYDVLRQIVTDFTGSARPAATRSFALAALPYFSQGQRQHLDDVVVRLEKESSIWAWWNLAYGLNDWPTSKWRRTLPWVYDMLERAAQHPSDHVSYAAAAVLAKNSSLHKANPSRADNIRSQVDGRPWRSNSSIDSGPLDYEKTNQTGIVYSPAFLEPAYDNHIECRERIQAILTKLEGVDKRHINWVNPRKATEDQIRWVHHGKSDRRRDGSAWPTYLRDVQETCERRDPSGNSGPVIGPIELRAESYDAALLSAGSVLEAVDYVKRGRAPAAWALNRPPGHLANNVICVFDNIALGAVYAQKRYGLKRILIIDCDAHHGKHVNEVFLTDPNVIYFSMHIDGDYAREDGTVKHVGKGVGKGYTFNLAYPADMPDAGYVLMADMLKPLAHDFRPELILIAAGFDGHVADHLTPTCILTDAAYIHLASVVRDIAQDLNIRVVGAVEGGYGLDALGSCMVNMMNIIGSWGLDPAEITGEITYNPKGSDKSLTQTRAMLRKRVKKMRKQRQKTSDYPFDLSQPHWIDFICRLEE